MQAKANAGGANWLENAVVCYMQAIRHGSAPARAMMPRILTLFSFHDSSGAVTQAIRKNSRQVCSSVVSPHRFLGSTPECVLANLHKHLASASSSHV